MNEDENTPQFFGIQRGNKYVRRFKIYFRDGRVVSMPYAHLPLFLYDPAGTLSIQSSEFMIVVKGRGLGKLTDWFSQEMVLWLKESPSGTDNGEAEVFIREIEFEIEGSP